GRPERGWGRGAGGPRRAAADRADEAIASTMGGLDEAGRLRIVGERLANLADGDFEDSFADERCRPGGVQERLFRDEAAGMTDEIFENGEGLGSELDGLRTL